MLLIVSYPGIYSWKTIVSISIQALLLEFQKVIVNTIFIVFLDKDNSGIWKFKGLQYFGNTICKNLFVQ